MQVGTKSLLFGCHQFIIHPIFVTIAWKKIYKQLPDWRSFIIIIIHDWGYWGCKNMDGEEGELHPWWAAKKAFQWFNNGKYWARFALYHSRFLAKKNNHKVSKLCLPDKLGVALMPTWLWVNLARLSGELDEYIQDPKYEIHNQVRGISNEDAKDFFNRYKQIVSKWVSGEVSLEWWRNE